MRQPELAPAAARVARTHAAAQQKLMWEALREAVDEEMEADPRVCMMGNTFFPHQTISQGTTLCPRSQDIMFSSAQNQPLHLGVVDEGEDVGHYGGSYKVSYDLHKKYGDMRLLDTPICGAQLPRMLVSGCIQCWQITGLSILGTEATFNRVHEYRIHC